MGAARANWRNTTHDWSEDIDVAHLNYVRHNSEQFAADGVLHMVLEVLAYPADEAADRGGGEAVIVLHADGSVSVSDNGRGTDTRVDDEGIAVRKPILATRDLRFFDHPEAETLPNGHSRRGISTVTALSVWVTHTNHRASGAWVQRYENGIPVTGLEPSPPQETSGTTVHFMPNAECLPRVSVSRLRRLAQTYAPTLTVRVDDLRETQPTTE